MTAPVDQKQMMTTHAKILSLLTEGVPMSEGMHVGRDTGAKLAIKSPIEKNNTIDNRSMRLGDILTRMGKLTPGQVKEIRVCQVSKGINFGRAALMLGYITEKDIRNAVSIQFGYFYSEEQKETVPSQLVMINQPFSKEAEHFRVLRTRLSQKENSAALRLLAVTATGDEEFSQPFIIANLAISLAQLKRRVLLIDGDLRRPRLHHVFNIEGEEGLSDVLSGHLNLSEALKPSMIRHLTVLPAGNCPYNPQELLSGDRFAELMMKMVDEYDTVLISSPGQKGIADGQYIWSLTKSVLVLARKDKSRISEVKEMTTNIRDCGAHVVGTVLSR